MPKILLIDDEELVTKSVSRFLAREGYEVTSCASGEEALKKLETHGADLIICDIRMPEQNGIETLKKIRQYLKEHRQKPVPEVLITGYADEKVNQEAEALRVADYLYKPFDLRDFLACVKKNLSV